MNKCVIGSSSRTEDEVLRKLGAKITEQVITGFTKKTPIEEIYNKLCLLIPDYLAKVSVNTFEIDNEGIGKLSKYYNDYLKQLPVLKNVIKKIPGLDEHTGIDFGEQISQAIKTKIQQQSDDTVHNDQQANLETTQSLGTAKLNKELNLLFLDYAFRGMYAMRNEFEQQFKSLIWESCFINRGTLRTMYPNKVKWSNVGFVSSTTQLNQNIKDLQESQYGILVDFLKSKNIQLAGDELYDSITGESTSAFLFSEQIIKNYFNGINTDELMRARLSNNPKDKKIVEAYKAYVLLSNFDSYISMIFGKDMEIIPEDQLRFNGGLKYRLADRSHTNRTTHAEMDEIIVDKLVNYIVKGGIETTSEYDRSTGEKKEGLYLNYADFANIMGDIKAMANSAISFLNVSEMIPDSISQEAKQYILKHKTLRSCIANMKFDMQNNLRYVLELISNQDFQRNQVIKRLFGQFNYDTARLDKLYSIYRGIFSNEEDSLYHMDLDKSISSDFTQNAASIYTNSILQYYKDRNGKTKVRYLYDQDLDNVQQGLENTVNSSHLIRLDSQAHNLLSTIDTKNIGNINFQYAIPVSSNLRIKVDTHAKSDTANATFTLETKNADSNWEQDVKGPSKSRQFLTQYRSLPEVQKAMSEFITRELCTYIDEDSNVLRQYTSLINSDKTSALSELLNFANSVCTNAIIKDEIFKGKFGNTNNQETLQKLQSVFGDNVVNISRSGVSLIDNRYVSVLRRLAQAIQLSKNKNLSSIVKSGDGNAFSPYSLSRLLGGIAEQVETQCTRPGSATRDSAFVRDPGFFAGVAKQQEYYTYNRQGKQVKSFNTQEFIYGGFLYQYISGLMPKDAVSKDVFGNGVIGIIPTTNSDKGEMSVALFNLRNYDVIDENGDTQPLFNIINSNQLTPAQKRNILYKNISIEIGNQYYTVADNIRQDFVNRENGFFTVINKYLQQSNYSGQLFTIDQNYDYVLGDFAPFKVWFEANSDDLRTIGINDHKDLFDKATLWYNTETAQGFVKPVELYDLVSCEFKKVKSGDGAKEFREITSNETLISLLYRFNPDEFNTRNIRLDENKRDTSRYYTINEFFNYKNKKTLYDLLKNNFSIDLSCTFISSIDNPALKRIRLNNQELFEIRKRLDGISDQKWYSQYSGKVVLAKYVTNENGEQEIHDIYDIIDYEKYINLDESAFLKSNSKIILNPLIEQYNLIDYLCSSEYTNCTVGSLISHPAKGKITKANTDREKVLARESLSYLAQTKRNVSLTAQMESFQLGTRTGIPSRLNIALIQDIYTGVWNNLGMTDRAKPFDGGTFANPFQVYWENNSLASARVGKTKKPYAHYYNERMMCAGMLKTASFPLTNEICRTSKMYKNLLRMSTDIKWRNADGSEWNGDITKSPLGGNQLLISEDGKILDNACYIKEDGQFYSIGLKYTGNNTYTVIKNRVTKFGTVMERQAKVQHNVVIDSNYKLWNVLGGENSYSANSTGLLVPSEQSIMLIADLANNLGTIKQQLSENDNPLDWIKVNNGYMYQVLKQANIHLLPTEGVVKMFQCNMNPNSVYNDINAKLNYSKITASQYGIQLDKEHQANDAELSMMTQVMNACAFRGFTFDIAKSLYSSLYNLNRLGVHDFLEPFERMMRSQGEDLEKATTDFYSALNKSLIKTLANRAGKTDRAKQYAQKILDRERSGETIDYSTLQIPFSSKSIYRQTVSSIASILTKQGIKHKIDGTLSVLTPSYDAILIYGNGSLSGFENDEQLMDFQSKICDANPAYDIEQNGDIKITPIIISAHNSQNEVVTVDAMRYTIDGVDGNVDLSYNFLTKEYDIIFNMDLNSLDDVHKQQIMSLIANAVPIGSDIRFAEGNEINQKNLSSYRLFKQFGFYDVQSNDKQFRHKVSKEIRTDAQNADYIKSNQLVIPNMRRSDYTQNTDNVKDKEQTQAANEAEEFEKHFDSKTSGMTKQVWNSIASNSNSDIVFVFTSDEHQQSIAKLKREHGDKVHIINISDASFSSNDFAESTKDLINQVIADIQTKAKQTISISMLGDDITKMHNRFINQTSYNKLMLQIIHGLVHDKKISIVSDGQSGFGFAAIMAAKHENKGWKIINGGDWAYRDRVFIFDNRTADERWTTEKSGNVQEISRENKMFYQAIPTNAVFASGTLLPDNVFYLLKDQLNADYQSSLERYDQKLQVYYAKKAEYDKKVEKHDKWEANGKEGSEPRVGRAPVMPSLENIKAGSLQDISGKTIQDILNIYTRSKSTDEKQFTIYDFTENDYQNILKPLYDLWAYQNPKVILRWKRRCAENTDMKLYDPSDKSYNIARVIGELLENVNWAYKYENYHLNPRGQNESINSALQISNKYIGADPVELDTRYGSSAIAMAQDESVVNNETYTKGDIVFLRTAQHIKHESDANEQIVDMQNEEIQRLGNEAIKQNAVLIIEPTDSICSNDETKSDVDNIRSVFGDNISVERLVVNNKKLYVVSNNIDNINILFTKIDRKIGQTNENGEQKWLVDDSVYVPSSLFRSLQMANNKIKLATNSTEEQFNVFDICLNLKLGRFDGMKGNWDIVTENGDPVLHEIHVGVGKSAYCFGKKPVIDMLNSLYNTKMLLTGAYVSKTGIDINDSLINDLNISDRAKKNLLGYLPIIKDISKSAVDRQQAYSNAMRQLEKLINIEEAKVNYISGNNSIESEIGIQNTNRIKDTHVDSEVSMAYTKVTTGQADFQNRFVNDIDLSDSTEINNGNIISSGLEYNELQSEAIRQSLKLISENIGETDQQVKTVMIDGRAGTGKTAIMDAILKNLDPQISNGAQLIVSALSNKMKNNLDNSLSQSIKNGKYQTYQALNIMQMLGLKQKNGTYDFSTVSEKAPIKSADIVVVDDVQMLNQQQIDAIRANMKRGSILFLIGDNSQIGNVDNISFDLDKEFVLGKNMRQGDNNPIIGCAESFLSNFNSDMQTQENQNGAVIASNSKILNEYTDVLQKAIQLEDPSFVKIITQTNNKADQLNKRIHKAFAQGNNNAFYPGELVISRQNSVAIDNMTECIIVAAENPNIISQDNGQGQQVSFSVQNITVKTQSGNVIKLKVIPDLLFGNNFNTRTQPWLSDYMKKNNIVDIDLSFAEIVNKIQGSSYDIVYVDYDDISNISDDKLSQHSKGRSMYTALTRARNIAVIISRKNSEQNTDINKLNDDISKNKEFHRSSQEYNVKGLERFKQNQDGTMIVLFDSSDGTDKFDFRKGDTLYDINDIRYEIIEDPVIYNAANAKQITQSFGGEIPSSAVSGNVVVKVRPVNNVNVKEVAQSKLAEQIHGMELDTNNVKNIDTTKIKIGFEYFVTPNCWHYTADSDKYNNFVITHAKSTNAITVNGDGINIDTAKMQDQFNGLSQAMQDVFKTLDHYIEYSIYKEVNRYLMPRMTEQQLAQKAFAMFNRSMPYTQQIKSISDYIQLTDKIRKGLIQKVVQNAAFGRNLATINYTFEDTNGNKFQLADLDSIRNIYELRDIKNEFKKGDKAKACKQLKDLFSNKLGIDFNVILEEQFDVLFKKADDILRKEQQFDFRALSKNSSDFIEDFRKLCNSNNITQGFCRRVIDWVNYTLGNFGQTTLKINGQNISLTPQNFKKNARIIEYLLQNRASVQINGKKVVINKSSIQCEPYEVVMPKVMATVFGLSAGDQVNDILDSYESDTFKRNGTPSDSVDYLGFFGKRLLQNWNSKISDAYYDICLKNITGKHTYIISSEHADKLNGKFRPAKYNVRTDINGNKIVVNPDGSDKLQIGQNDSIYIDNFGCEVIVTDNPKLYLDNIKYSYITFGKDVLSDTDLANKYIDDIISVAENGSNEQLSKIIDEQVSENGELDKGNVFLYIKNMSENPSKIYEKFRKEGIKIYASFKTSLDVIASRIPAQCQHSFMPMRVAGFVDSDVNNAYVSVDQIWLQGSDYDIDTVSLASYSIDPGGKLYLWSPYANYNTYEQIQESRKLPMPSGKEYRVNDGAKTSNEDIEYIKPTNNIEQVLEFFNKYKNLFRHSKDQMFSIKPNANIADVIRFLQDKPIIYNPDGELGQVLRRELISAGFINKINERDIINRYNQALLAAYNKHNLYIKNIRSPHVQKLISNNITISAMIETSQDAQNMIESRTPIDSCKDEWTSIAETSKNNDIEYRQPGSATLKANGIVENQIGKDCISIAAVGLKALSAIQYYYNQILNTDQDPRQNNLFFNTTIDGQTYDLPVDIRPKSANTLTASMLRKLVAVANDTDPALAFSALLSLSVDNAKDLSLSKLNANPATMGMYLFGLTIGVPVDTLTSIMMGPIGDMFIEIMRTNSFTKQNDSFDRIGGILYYLDKGLFNVLKDQYNYRMANGTKQALTAYETLCNIAAKMNNADDNISVYVAEDMFRKAFSECRTTQASVNYLDKLQKKCQDQFEGMNNDYTAKIFQMIDQMKNYVRYKNIIKENAQAFKDFCTLQKGAEEMKTLGRILGLNQGLKNKEDEADRMLITLQQALGDVDLETFVFDEQERQKAIDRYEKKKVAFNILGIIANKEDVFGFIKDMVIARKGSDRSAKYKFGLSNYESVKRGLGLKNSDTDVIKGLRNFYDDMIMNDFIKSKNFSFEVEKGTMIFGKDGKPIRAESNIRLTLGSDINNASFINWFNTVFMPNMKATYGGNKFIASLSPYSTNKTTDRNETIYYALPAINMSPREDSEQVLFDDYSSAFNELKQAVYNGIPVHDIFAYYNIVAQGRAIGEKTMTKFLDAADSEIINQLEQYIALRDAGNEDLKVGNYQGADIRLNEVLPYVVPLFGSFGSTSSNYARYRNPFTGRYEIIQKKQESLYDDEYDLDDVIDIDDDFGGFSHSPYPEGWNSVSTKKINSMYFSDSVYNSADSVNYKYHLGDKIINVKITYSKDYNQLGYHRIYSVIANDPVFSGQRINFKYNRIKVEFDSNRIPNITFDEINTTTISENDKEFFKLDPNMQSENQRLNLGKRNTDSSGKAVYWPDVIVKYQNGNISEFKLSIGDNIVELNPSELTDGRQPMISDNRIPRDILEKIIESYEKKKQNGCV